MSPLVNIVPPSRHRHIDPARTLTKKLLSIRSLRRQAMEDYEQVYEYLSSIVVGIS